MIAGAYADAEDIGCVYNDQTQALANATAIRNWIATLQAGNDGDPNLARRNSTGLAITGPKDVSGKYRLAGTLYVDCNHIPG